MADCLQCASGMKCRSECSCQGASGLPQPPHILPPACLHICCLPPMPQWGAVERRPRRYDWAGYRQLFALVRALGLKLQVSCPGRSIACACGAAGLACACRRP